MAVRIARATDAVPDDELKLVLIGVKELRGLLDQMSKHVVVGGDDPDDDDGPSAPGVTGQPFGAVQAEMVDRPPV
jgi:hypothetical protein